MTTEIFDFETCTKDTLAEYASRRGIELDMRRTLDSLIQTVKDRLAQPESAPAATRWPARFLKHPVNNRIYEFTPDLLEHGLKPCDQDGNLL